MQPSTLRIRHSCSLLGAEMDQGGLVTTFHAFEQEAVAAVNRRDNYEALCCEGRLYVETRDQDKKAARELCSWAETNRHQLVKEAEDRKTEMQIVLASVGGDNRA